MSHKQQANKRPREAPLETNVEQIISKVKRLFSLDSLKIIFSFVSKDSRKLLLLGHVCADFREIFQTYFARHFCLDTDYFGRLVAKNKDIEDYEPRQHESNISFIFNDLLTLQVKLKDGMDFLICEITKLVRASPNLQEFKIDDQISRTWEEREPSIEYRDDVCEYKCCAVCYDENSIALLNAIKDLSCSQKGPAKICKLSNSIHHSNLRVLILNGKFCDNVGLGEIQQVLEKHPNLEIIDIESSEEIPVSIGCFSKMASITSLTGFFEIFDIENGISNFQNSVFNFAGLKELRLESSNGSKFVGAILSKACNLEYLDICNAKFSHETIGSLKKLRVLKLQQFYCTTSELFDQIEKLVCLEEFQCTSTILSLEELECLDIIASKLPKKLKCTCERILNDENTREYKNLSLTCIQ